MPHGIAPASLISTNYASKYNLQFSMVAVVPLWLQYISTLIIASAKGYGSRLGKDSRRFGFVQHGSATSNLYTSYIYCTGKYVQQLAWDLTFKVPVGGFKYGDIDPLTGEPFPGGKSKKGKGTYVTLIDKPEIEGHAVKSVARTYSKYSGRTITKAGFFSQAIRKNIGSGVVLSPVGNNNLHMLGLLVGKEMAHAIGNQIKWECAKKGLSCYAQGPDVITTTW